MIRGLTLFLFFVVAYAMAEAVVTLTDATLKSTVEGNEFVLVEFYAPWCGHCKALAPEYEKAAEQLASFTPKVVIAKLDATAEKQAAQDFGIEGFPTLKWFVNGVPSEYNGGRTADTIVSWVKKKTGPATKTIATAADVESFKKEGEVVVVGAFASAATMKAYEDVARGEDAIQFASVINPSSEMLAALGVKTADSIVLFKKFDEGRNEYSGSISDAADIKKFVAGNSLPIIVAFSQQTAPKIFGGGVKRHLLLFLDSKNEATAKEVKATATPVAQKHKGEVLFVTIDKTDERVLEFFGVTAKDLPTARLVTMADGGMKKYRLVGEGLTAETISESIKKLMAGELPADLKSEEIPADNNGPVTVLVGKNFDEIVTNRGSKDVLVEFYAPWCGHCKKLAPIWDQLGEKYKDNENIIIAKMDSTANEVDSVQVSGFPTLKFFPGNGGAMMDYDGARELDALVSFLEKNAKSCGA